MSVDTFVQYAALVLYGLAAFGVGYAIADRSARRHWERQLRLPSARELALEAEVKRLQDELVRRSQPPHRYRG